MPEIAIFIVRFYTLTSSASRILDIEDSNEYFALLVGKCVEFRNWDSLSILRIQRESAHH